jgi:hypothetical protein
VSRLNPAVRDHLRRIADVERARTVKWMCRARAVLATLYALDILVHVVTDGLPEARATLPILLVYASVAGVVAVLVELGDEWRRRALYTVALLDLPVVLVAGLAAIPFTAGPTYVVYSVMPITLLLLTMTILTLDYGAIILSTLVALVGIGVIVDRVGAPWVEAEDPLFGTAAIGGIALLVVSRLRALVEESRRKDFAGKYVLGKRLGAGGMAEVFEATYSPEGSFERKVAVKRVLPAYADNEEFVALFRREAELGALMHHPNLVQVFDFGRHMDSWFIAMELVEGVSLSQLMRQRGKDALPLSACLYVIGEVAEALAYLHEKPSGPSGAVGLVHRDISQPNILVSKNGEVKVSDFGVARWAESSALTRVGTVRGKLSYMAPEYLRGGVPTTGGDLFALGVVSYELLVRKPLFRGSSDESTIRRVLEAPIPPLREARPDVPPAVVDVIERLLERDPQKRVRSARSVSAVLRSLDGPEAPYPNGRIALAAAIETLEVRPQVSLDRAAAPTTPLRAGARPND